MRRGIRVALATEKTKTTDGAGDGAAGNPPGPQRLDSGTPEPRDSKPRGKDRPAPAPAPEPEPEPEAASAGQDSAWANAAALAGGPVEARGSLGAP